MATRARKRAARTIRNMQVPAYWPVILGCQAREKRGVEVEVKKVIYIWDMGMEVDVEVGLDMSMPMATTTTTTTGMSMFMSSKQQATK
ncbi:hypothetical protein CFE70_003565 [Pyrenophora teres f. teres 0-1]